MIAMLGILSNIWPFLLAGGGLLFGLFSHLNAKAKTAAAGQQVAQAQTVAAAAKTQVAETENAEAQANAAAAQAGADSLKGKEDVTNTVAAMPSGAAASELRNDWSK